MQLQGWGSLSRMLLETSIAEISPLIQFYLVKVPRVQVILIAGIFFSFYLVLSTCVFLLAYTFVSFFHRQKIDSFLRIPLWLGRSCDQNLRSEVLPLFFFEDSKFGKPDIIKQCRRTRLIMSTERKILTLGPETNPFGVRPVVRREVTTVRGQGVYR